MYLQIGHVYLRVIDLQRYERTAVFTEDGMDLQGVRHVLGCTAVYAPGGLPTLTSVTALSRDTTAVLDGSDPTATFILRDPRGEAPGVVRSITDPPSLEPETGKPADPGEHRSGPETDAELRLRLMQPRQKIILWAYDMQTGQPVRWLESPRPGFTTDADGGPFVLSLDVISVSGEPQSIGVYIQISTFLPACPVGSDRFVLSHRWQTEHGHDEDNYLTRTIVGTARFHHGIKELLGLNPDAVRRQLIHPIPLGFRRTVPEILLSPDGCTLRYTIRDTCPTIVFAPGDSNCTQIQIAEQFNYNTTGFGRLMNYGQPVREF